MNAIKLIPAWYVLHTRSRFEKVVDTGLRGKRIETFLPLIRVRSKRRDRLKMIDVPLFPGYTFVQTDLDPRHHLKILKTVGAVRLVGNTDGPIAVPTDHVESIKIMVRTGLDVCAGEQFKEGDPVLVVAGPLMGVTGYFVRYGSQGRVVVNVDALGQAASVHVDREEVELLPDIAAKK